MYLGKLYDDFVLTIKIISVINSLMYMALIIYFIKLLKFNNKEK